MASPGPSLRAVLAPIQAAIDRDDLARAARLAGTALVQGFADPLLYNLAAWAAEQGGRLDEAETLLERGLALDPRDATLLLGLGALQCKRLRPNEAVATLDRALAAEPDIPGAWHEKGLALDMLGERVGAVDCQHRAHRSDPADPAPLASLAALASLDGDWPRTRSFAEQALARDPAQPLATCMLARAEIATGDPARARDRLAALLARPGLANDVVATARSLRGDAHDLLDETEAAFADWREAKAIERALAAPVLGPGGPVEGHLRFVERVHAAFRAQPAACWEQAGAPEERAAGAHLFVLGYPRSGTTLVASMLAAAPGVTATEERPTLADAEQAFLADDAGMARLARIGVEEIAHYRARYWQRVAGEDVEAARGAFVDMAPLTGVKLPLIAKLFPEARIVVVRRDPRDVVLSCLRQRFKMNAGTYIFTDLADTADHYAAVMRAMDGYLQHLPLRVHELRYRDLVGDFDAASGSLYSFAGLEGAEGARDFHKAAQGRALRTASATQVRRPLYNGEGQWRRYAKELAPVMAVLEPWVARYEAEATGRE